MTYHQALCDHLTQADYNYFLTFNFNDKQVEYRSLSMADKKIREWHKRIKRRLYGPRWYKKDINIDLFYVAEHLSSNIHYHALIKVPQDKLAMFEQWAGYEWEKLNQYGTFYSSQIMNQQELENTSRYCIKSLIPAKMVNGTDAYNFI